MPWGQVLIQHVPRGTEGNLKKLIQGSWNLGWELYSKPLEFKAEGDPTIILWFQVRQKQDFFLQTLWYCILEYFSQHLTI
jgi:hypothetical protein